MFKDMRVDFYNKTDKQRKRVLLNAYEEEIRDNLKICF